MRVAAAAQRKRAVNLRRRSHRAGDRGRGSHDLAGGLLLRRHAIRRRANHPHPRRRAAGRTTSSSRRESHPGHVPPTLFLRDWQNPDTLIYILFFCVGFWRESSIKMLDR